ncbi:MAG: hypothetical protein QXD77_00335 [Candidatus Aenigmatarchaeota archaeon]
MPDILKKILEKYPDLKPVKVFPFDMLESGDVRYAFHARGKLDDGAPKEMAGEYEDVAKKGDLLVWKMPKTFANMARRIGYAAREGLPERDESFYDLVYVFVAEVDAEGVAASLKADFADKEDAALVMQAGDLGYLFKRER